MPEIISVFVSILFLGFSVTLRSSAEIKIRVGYVPGTFLLFLTFIKRFSNYSGRYAVLIL